MSEEQVVKLLEEIRDLHKEGVENQKIAIANQQQSIERQKQSIENQKKAISRAKVTLGIVIALFLLMFGAPMFLWGLSWTLRWLTAGH